MGPETRRLVKSPELAPLPPPPIAGTVAVALFYISPVASGAPEKAEPGSDASCERCGSCGTALGGSLHPLGGNGGAASGIFSVKQGAAWLVCRFKQHTLYSSALGMSLKQKMNWEGLQLQTSGRRGLYRIIVTAVGKRLWLLWALDFPGTEGPGPDESTNTSSVALGGCLPSLKVIPIQQHRA